MEGYVSLIIKVESDLAGNAKANYHSETQYHYNLIHTEAEEQEVGTVIQSIKHMKIARVRCIDLVILEYKFIGDPRPKVINEYRYILDYTGIAKASVFRDGRFDFDRPETITYDTPAQYLKRMGILTSKEAFTHYISVLSKASKQKEE